MGEGIQITRTFVDRSARLTPKKFFTAHTNTLQEGLLTLCRVSAKPQKYYA
jgi:hypothetical protein